MVFKCKNCGGNVVYEPSRGHMYCPHCESLDSEDAVQGGSLTQCAVCGAPLAVRQYASSGRCEHCGSYLVFNERVEGEYEPCWILPFCLNKDSAVEAMEREFGRRLFTPTDFMSTKSLEKMEGRYVPFWLYDYQAHYDFAGEGTVVRSWTSGDTEYVETSYYEVIRQMDVDFDRIPADASYELADGVMDLMEPYDYGALTDYAPKYMSGFYGEIYNQDARELEERAKAKAREASEELLRGSLQGYTGMRTLDRKLEMHADGVHYALMPVWQYLYRYRGKTYAFHINGQTGKVVGTTPVSRGKVLAYGASVFVIVAAICRLALNFLEIL